MDISCDAKCLVLAKDESAREIEDILSPHYNLMVTHKNFFDPSQILRRENILCVVVYIKKGYFDLIRPALQLSKSHFSFIPFISILHEVDLEIVRICGHIGIDRVLDRGTLYSLKNVVSSAIQQHTVRVKASDFGIDRNGYPLLVNRALRFVEENYLSLMSSKEIAEFARISDCALSRIFRQHQLVGPKRLLMFFKVRHAVYLMENKSLGIKDIAILSGFTDEKRINDCFHRIFQTSTFIRFRSELTGNEQRAEMWHSIFRSNI